VLVSSPEGSEDEEVTAELRTLAAETGIAAAASGRESRAHGSGTGALEHLLETSLDLGVYGPALEFFRALAAPLGDPCAGGAFIVMGSTTVCTVSAASASVASRSRSHSAGSPDGDVDAAADVNGAMHVGEWDLPYPVTGEAAAGAVGAWPSAVLVGVPGTRAYCALHTALVDMVKQVQCHPCRCSAYTLLLSPCAVVSMLF